MRQIEAKRFGAPNVLEACEVRDPIAGPGQVVIDVSVADTLYLDTVLRSGNFPFAGVAPPYVPGGGVAGEILAVGPDVDRGLRGRRVVARTGADELRSDVETVAALAQRDSHTGGYAEQAVVLVSRVIPVPDEVCLSTAAALVNDGMTAMMLIEAAGIRPGDRVLITPCGGGVGNLLVQLAHAAGAHVIGAARGARKLELARSSGAAAALDYEHGDWAAHVRALTEGRGADIVLDGVGGSIGHASLDVTASGGRFIGYGAPSGQFTQAHPEYAARRGIRVDCLLNLPMRAGDERRFTERALTDAAAGRLVPHIGRTVPLDRAAEAHAAIEDRAVVGKTLLPT